jgi:hypothetical protein
MFFSHFFSFLNGFFSLIALSDVIKHHGDDALASVIAIGTMI